MPSASIEIARPAPEVFDFVCRDHFANHPRWDDSIVAVEGADGPAQRGTTATLVRKAGPLRLRERSEVKTFDPPRSATFLSHSGPLAIEVLASIRERGEEGATASLTATVEARGPARLALPLIRRNVQRSIERSVQEIKQLMEVEHGDGDPR